MQYKPRYLREKALVEMFNQYNVHHDPIEEAKFIEASVKSRMRNDLDKNRAAQEFANEFGMSISTVYKKLALLNLSEKALLAMRSGQISACAAQTLSSCYKEDQDKLLNAHLRWGGRIPAKTMRSLVTAWPTQWRK